MISLYIETAWLSQYLQIQKKGCMLLRNHIPFLMDFDNTYVPYYGNINCNDFLNLKIRIWKHGFNSCMYCGKRISIRIS